MGVKRKLNLNFFFDKVENASQVVEMVKGVYGADTVTVNFGVVDSVQACLMLKKMSIMSLKSQK